jgi:hypothetical protein
MLSNMGSPVAIADRQRLEALDRRDTHLALVRYHYQNIRANILYARLDPRGRGRIQISAELPLIYATGRRAETPEVHFPADADGPPKAKRTRESKIEPESFLRSLPIHRYGRLRT